MEYGIQMYSLRDVTDKDLDKALASVAEMGYTSVEFAGFFEHSAESVKAMLDKYSLKVSGTHTGYSELFPENIEKTVEYHKAIGNKNIIIPGFDRKEATLDKLIETINFAIPILKENGITLGYHNHSFEFLPTEYGRNIHRELETKTDVEFEIDTFWAYNAGLNPVDVIERLRERIRVIHLKDGIASADGSERGAVGLSVGMGNNDIISIVKKAKKLGIAVVVESEGLDPTGEDEVRRCIEYLKTLDI